MSHLWYILFSKNHQFLKCANVRNHQKMQKKIGENHSNCVFKPIIPYDATRMQKNTHSGQENLKKSRPKKLVESKNLLTKIHFLQFQNLAKIRFLNWEKV